MDEMISTGKIKDKTRWLSEQHLGIILDTIQVGILIIDEQTRTIVDLNRAAADMIGNNRDSILGNPCWCYFSTPETQAYPVTRLGQMSSQTEQVLITASGEKVPIVKTVTSVSFNGTKHLLESFLDVSQLKKAQEELERANRRIIEQQKALIEEERFKVLLQMAGVTAHELNQPLTALLGKIELMKMDRERPEKLAAHINTLEQAGCRILEIAKRIQQIRRDESWPVFGFDRDLDLSAKLNIVYVEDSDDDFQRIGHILQGFEQISLFRARNMAEAERLLEHAEFDLIFLEHVFSDGKSLDFLEMMSRRDMDVPVVVITGYGNEMIASQVIQYGAYDYLPKDFVSKESLTRTIANALAKSRLKKEIKRAHERMMEMSITDPLTGLYNRRYFVEALERETARAARYGSGLVLCMVDIDHFKVVNDTYGHLAGDMVLSQLGRLLKEYMRESDVLCRFGGEEFAIILTHTAPEQARLVCERFREMVAAREFNYHGPCFHVTVSIGMASYTSPSDSTAWQLVESADHALYEAKAKGRNRVIEYIADSPIHPAGVGSEKMEPAQVPPMDKIPLGEILVRSGRITATQRDQAMAYQDRTFCRIGDALRKLGHVTAEDVRWAVDCQRLLPNNLQCPAY